LIIPSVTGVCEACWDALESWRGPACAVCGTPFAADLGVSAAQTLCSQCREGEFAFDLARSLGLYRGVLRSLILQLKFHRRERLGERLGARLAEVWNSLGTACVDARPLLVPVPLHGSRERERGFNQSALLAGGLSRALARTRGGAGFEARALLRTKATPPQTGLSLAARRDNVRGAFSVAEPERVRDRVVVLIDDVMTTGSTLSACAGALKAAGAGRVLALTLARATPQFPDREARAGSGRVDDFGWGR
jgi:ComF family protein